MIRNKQKLSNLFKRLFPYLFFCFLIETFCFLCKKINFIYVPDSDFLLYLNEGHKLLSNPLERVVAPPLYSIIVYLFEAFLPIKHPGITGGTVFNIFCFVASLWFMWKLSKRWMRWFGLLVVLLLVINPMSLFVNLQPLNMPLASLLVLMALYYNEKFPVLSYGLALLAFFSRPEAIGVLVVFLIQGFVIKKRPDHLAWLIIAVFVATAWYVRPLLRTQKSDYFAEMTARSNEIPNIAFLRNSFAIAPFLTLSQASINDAYSPLRLKSDTSAIALLSLVWITCGVMYCYKKRFVQPVVVFGYVLLYTLVHVLFPDKVLRYSYPILPFIYMLLFWPAVILNGNVPRIQKAVSVLIIVALTTVIVASVLLNGSAYLESQRWIRAEKRLVGEWLTTNVQKPSVVYALEFRLSQYYTENKNIYYADTTNPHSWSNDLCTYNQNVYVVIDSTTEEPAHYFDYLDGLNYFVRVKTSKVAVQHLVLTKTLRIDSKWAKIYTVNKSADDWCKIFTQ